MEVSITAVTANRKFTKALVRNAELVNKLRLNRPEIRAPFDILQLVYVDSDEGYLKVSSESTQIVQVDVGIGSIDRMNKLAFVTRIAEQIKAAMRLTKVPSTGPLIIDHVMQEIMAN